MGVAVEVEGLSKSFGSQNIWSDVTLTLPPGEISVLLGPSGTGKSVFLKTLVGLLKPDRGSITIEGVSLTVSALEGSFVEVSLIPETLERTTLGERQPGDRVNVECDVLARYVQRMLPGVSPLSEQGSD